jgi:hypothetical protein
VLAHVCEDEEADSQCPEPAEEVVVVERPGQNRDEIKEQQQEPDHEQAYV